jgi:hypothetical protein
MPDQKPTLEYGGANSQSPSRLLGNHGQQQAVAAPGPGNPCHGDDRVDGASPATVEGLGPEAAVGSVTARSIAPQ